MKSENEWLKGRAEAELEGRGREICGRSSKGVGWRKGSFAVRFIKLVEL